MRVSQDLLCRNERAEVVKPMLLILSLVLRFNIVEGTISIISDKTGDTVFSVEEAGVDTTSGFNLEGRLVISSPLNACEAVLPPPVVPSTEPPPKTWVVISTVQKEAEKESCSLSRKAKNAQSAGYSGIIFKHVGSNDTEGILPKFIGLDWIGVTIYACVVGDDIGSFLMEKYTYPQSYFLRFENEPHWPIGLLANFVIIGFLGVICVLLLLRLFYYLYYRVTRSVVQRRRLRKALLSEKQLKKLPILKWTSSIPQDTCSICIELFVADEEIRVLPCSHVFHKICIDPWLSKESRKCPNCKRRVLFPNEKYSFSSDESVDSDSGDEQTPLLRHSRRRRSSDENYRFVETLTESHNSRALSQQHYDEIPGSSRSGPAPEPGNTWAATSCKPSSGAGRSSVPKVTFAPTKTGRSGSGNANSSQVSTKAFVLPSAALGHRHKHPPVNSARNLRLDYKPPLATQSSSNPTASSSVMKTKQVTVGVERFSDDSNSSTSNETLVECNDAQLNEAQNSSSLSDSTEVNSLSSFHSCQGFSESYDVGDEHHKELFQSFTSHNS